MAGQADIQLRLKHGAFEVQQTLRRGEWGVTQDDSGRIYRNTNESALHVDLVPTRVFRPQSESAAHARQLRAARRRQSRAERRLARAAEPGHQPRVSVRHPSRRRIAGEVHGGVRAARLSRRSPAVRAVRQRVRRRARRERREPDRRSSDDGTTLARAEGVRARRIPGVDRRALPARLSRQRARRHDVRRRHVSRDPRAPPLDDDVPARSDSRAQAGAADRVRPHLSRRARHDPARHVARRSSKASPAELVATLSHPNGWWRDTAQRLLVERGSVTARTVSVRRPPSTGGRLARWRSPNADGLADAPARALDARRDRRASSRRPSRRRWRIHRATCARRPSAWRSGGSARRTIRSRRRS